MLVLSRKLNEVIKIGDDITVTIVQIDAHKVRLGIVAPLETVVDRAEVAEAKKRNNPVSGR